MDDQPTEAPRPAMHGKHSSRPPRPVVVAVAVVTALALAVGLGAFEGSDDVIRIDDPTTPADLETSAASDELPEVTLRSLSDGSTLDLAASIDGPTVINFFAAYCAPCVAEMPDIESVHQSLGDAVRFIGVNQGARDRPDDARRIVAQTGVTYEIWRDDHDALFNELGAFAMPTTVFIDADGAVVRMRAGAVSADELRDLIRRTLGV